MQSLLSGYHQGDVTGLSGCLRKPIVASTAADRTLRLWNFNERLANLGTGCAVTASVGCASACPGAREGSLLQEL